MFRAIVGLLVVIASLVLQLSTAALGRADDNEDGVINTTNGTAGVWAAKSSSGSSGRRGPDGEPCGPPTRVLCPVYTPGPSVASVATSVATKVKLPVPSIRFGPEPSANKWNMIPVGYALWVWTEGRSTLSSDASKDGLSVSLRAVPGETVFTMGDGNTLRCGYQPVWIKGNTQKSTCSYTYEYPSPEGEPYVVSATTTWDVQWTAAGRSGSLSMERTASRTITIGELHSLRER